MIYLLSSIAGVLFLCHDLRWVETFENLDFYNPKLNSAMHLLWCPYDIAFIFVLFCFVQCTVNISNIQSPWLQGLVASLEDILCLMLFQPQVKVNVYCKVDMWVTHIINPSLSNFLSHARAHNFYIVYPFVNHFSNAWAFVAGLYIPHTEHEIGYRLFLTIGKK